MGIRSITPETTAPGVILDEYEVGANGQRNCFFSDLGRVTLIENNEGSTSAVLHDVIDEATQEPMVRGFEVSPIGLDVDEAVIKGLQKLSKNVSKAVKV